MPPSTPLPFDRRDLVWLVVLIAFGLWAQWGVTRVGPFGDDYMQHAMVTGQYPGSYAPWDLYDFVRNDPPTRAAHLRMGVVPWWTAPDLYGGLLRPGPSLTVWLDHSQFPRDTYAHRIHTLGWWALTLTTAGLVLRRLFGRPIAIVALAIYAVDHGAILPLSWLANRVLVQTAAVGFLALWLHLRWREDGLRHGMWWTLAAMTVTFSCGEYAFVIAAYVFAYEVLRGRRLSPAEGRVGWMRALGPTVAPAVVYLVLHVVGHYGTVGSAMYVHPFTDPVGYLGWAIERVPRLLAELVWSTPSETWEFSYRYDWHPGGEGRGGHALLACGLLVAAAVAYALVRPGLRTSERKALGWLVLGAALGTLPVASAPAHGRLLLAGHLGGVSLVALLIVGGLRTVLGSIAARGWRKIPALLLVGTLAWMHGPSDRAYAQRTIARLELLHDGILYTMATPRLQEVDLQGRDVIVLSSVVLTLVIHAPLVADYNSMAVPRSWHVLSTNDSPLAVVRTAENSISVSYVMGESWLSNAQDRLFCPEPRTLPKGTVLEVGPFSAKVLADDDGRPTMVDFIFERSLDDPRYVFLQKRGLNLVPFELPEVGKVKLVPMPSRG